MDNGMVFLSQQFMKLLSMWHVRSHFRAIYRPESKGIVGRYHRTIKRLSERAEISLTEAVKWYNLTLRSGIEEKSIPQRSLFRYMWRIHLIMHGPTSRVRQIVRNKA